MQQGHCSPESMAAFASCEAVEFDFMEAEYLFLAVQSLDCCVGFPLVAESRAYCLVAVHKFLPVVASFVVEHGL